jgi:glycosyltransferase involved in cell wall biosynthesis
MTAQRFLYVINGNGLSPELGGSVVRSANIAKRLASMGNDVTLMTTSGGLSACAKLGLVVPSVILPASLLFKHEWGMASRLWSYVVSSVCGVLRVSSLPQVDWLYTDSDYPCDVLPALAYRRQRGGRWVAMIHHLVKAEAARSVSGAMKRSLQQWMHSIIARHADVVFTYATESGDEVVGELLRLGMKPSRLRRVHNGYDSLDLASTAAAPEHADACLIGGLRRGKGLYEIVPIWRRVCSVRPESRLVIVGGVLAHNRQALEAEIERAGLSGTIIILGPQSHAKAVSVLKASTLMISPSLEEGWGIAVCEALACGIPVVAYDLPAYRSLFAGGMRRVPIGERTGCADAVLDLLADAAQRVRLSAEAKLAVAQYEWNSVAVREIELLGEPE